MKLDASDLRYISHDEFRVLTAAEMGSKNHEVVPVELIAQISGLRTGGVNKCIGELAKRNLIAKVPGARYEGYRLTYGGYDYLAMRTFAKRDTVYSVGNQIGTGKESDIYVVANQEGDTFALKIHRLGRISFRTIKSKRDYLRKGQSASWMYMSRLAAMKEYAFMKVLHEHGFPVPTPIDQARHCLVMELFDAFPLRQISDIPSPGALYSELMDLIVRLARSGLIHGDFNEFNILIRETTSKDPETEEETVTGIEPIVIDFPQMVSTSHMNAEYYFNRDVDCIRTFFKKRFRYESTVYPRFTTIMKDGKKDFELDVVVAASGWGKKEGDELESYMNSLQQEDEDEGEEDDGSDENEEDESEKEDEETNSQAEEIQEASTSGTSGVENRLSNSTLADSDESEKEDREELESEDESSEGEDKPTRRTKRTPRQQPRTQATKKDVQTIVASSMDRKAKSAGRKHHGNKGPSLGRAKGSKKKSDPRSAIKDSVQF